MKRSNVLSKFELGDIIKLQVSRAGKDGLYLVDSEAEVEEEIFIPYYEVKDKLNKYDYVYVGVDLDSKGKKVITTKLGEVCQKYSNKAQNVKRGDKYTGMIYNLTEFGAFAINKDKVIGLIHEDDINSPLKIGNQVEGRITFVREDGRVNFSLRPLKEIGRITDAERILEFLRGRKGAMPYSDETPAEVIKDKFNISKSSFKRALGKLLKDGLIEQKEGWTHLTQKGNQ